MGSSGPKTTKDSSGSFSIGGQNLATSTLGKNGYSTSVNFNPDQQKIWDTSNKGISDALGSISGIIGQGNDPTQHNTYRDELYQPVADTIHTNYDTARDKAYARFGSIGGLNSLGFNRYNNNILTKNEDKALSGAKSQADLQAYQLPSVLLNPITQALGAFSGAQNQLFGQATGGANGAMQGQQASNQYNTANNLFNQNSSGGGGFWNSYLNFIDPLSLTH